MINFGKKYNVHFVGIGGVSMHSLALFCKKLGWCVTGSDITNNCYVEKCKSEEIKVFIGHRKTNIKTPDFIVCSSAIKENNPEIRYAKKLSIKIMDRVQFLSLIIKEFKIVIAVSGSHGKSTTSAMIYSILRNAKKKVSCQIGAEIDNAKLDINDDYLVVEACEYNKNFLKFKVDIGVVLNVEKDHMECYGSFFSLKNAFLTFLKHAKTRYVFDNSSTDYINVNNLIKVSKPKCNKNKFVFDKRKYCLKYCLGEQYIHDATVAIKVCTDLGVNYKIIYDTLKNFRPLSRRQELIGEINGVDIYIDYAHHPTEIKCMVDSFKGKVLFVFQPHTFSRTKFLKKEFIEVLSNIDIIIYKEYSAREKEDEGISAYELYKEVVKVNSNCQYADNLKDLEVLIKGRICDKVVFLGAGDIDLVAKKLL